MENYSIVLFIMAIMIGLSAMADKIKLPYPVLLTIAGISIGFIPSLPHIELESEVIFLIFLPPLLYDAAFNISFGEFKTHLNTISTLAISLVFFSAAGIAIFAYYVIPGMTWPLAFVLGSILSATDAVVAMSITKGLGLSHKTITILEGESLVNDASALVAYRFAVAAVTGSAFVFWKAGLNFLVVLGGGFLIGFILGRILSFVLMKVHGNNSVVIGFSLLMPFVTYQVAEELNVSGVIAVVILGLTISRVSKLIFPDSLKQQSRNIWDIIIFLLNGFIFILLGLQFPYLLKTLEKGQLGPFLFYAFLITVIAFLVRMLRVYLQKVNLEKAFLRKRKRITEHALLDGRTSVIIGWSGMRGIVSLATAIGLPLALEDGAPFPMRTPIVFISVATVLFTLIVQGLSLPWVVKKLKPDKPVVEEKLLSQQE
jgi:Na+/H+ antiporter